MDDRQILLHEGNAPTHTSGMVSMDRAEIDRQWATGTQVLMYSTRIMDHMEVTYPDGVRGHYAVGRDEPPGSITIPGRRGM